MFDELEAFMKDDVRKRLEDKYGADWFKVGVPRSLRVEAGKMRVERNADRFPRHEITEWDSPYIVNCRDVMTQSQDLGVNCSRSGTRRPATSRSPAVGRRGVVGSCG